MCGMTEGEHAHKRFSDKLAFFLNNPIRRKFSPPERLIEKLGIQPNTAVLDFGCGPGFFLVPAARAAGKAIGVDVSPRMLERAAKYAKKSNVPVELIESDGKSIKLPDNSVDLIFLVHVFHEIDDKLLVLKEFLRILKPSGRLAIIERSKDSWMSQRKLGPPVVDVSKVAAQIVQGGFTSNENLQFDTDSIILGRK